MTYFKGVTECDKGVVVGGGGVSVAIFITFVYKNRQCFTDEIGP